MTNKKTMNYFEHMLVNFKVTFRCLVMAVFHLVHGVIPCEYTSHNFWGFNFKDSTEEI